MQVRRQKGKWATDADEEWFEVKTMDEVLRMSLVYSEHEHFVYEGGLDQPLAIVANGRVKTYYTVVDGALIASGGYVHPNHAEAHGHDANERCDPGWCYPGDWPRGSWLWASDVKTGGE